jgi:hypothetical protein
MRRKKRPGRFINLAEQLALQNDIVNSTMDSLLGYVASDSNVEQRSDWDEIQKTAIHMPDTDVNGQETDKTSAIPRPKLSRTSTSAVENRI